MTVKELGGYIADTAGVIALVAICFIIVCAAVLAANVVWENVFQ